MKIEIEVEEMNGNFTKYHLPGGFVLHHFTGVDLQEDPHDHPWPFESHVLSGGYTEHIYSMNNTYSIAHRKPGDVFYVLPNHIHRIVSLPDGECWTIVVPGKKVHEPSFYKFADEGYYKRFHFEPNFKFYEYDTE